jgi:hypothetical protein
LIAAVGLPVAVLLGLLAELAGAVVRVAFGREPWQWRDALEAGRDLRRLAREGGKAEAGEFLGGAAALFGSALAAAGAIGLGSGAAAVVYGGLVLAALGGHLAAALPRTRAAEQRVVEGRRWFVLAEPAFLAALGALLLRWEAPALEEVRGAQAILGPGISVGPLPAAAGLGLATMILLAAGMARLVPRSEAKGGARRDAASALIVRLARWGAVGSTVLVASVAVAGTHLPPSQLLRPGFLVWVGGALGLAALAGAADEGLVSMAARRGLVAAGLFVGAAAAVVLVRLP